MPFARVKTSLPVKPLIRKFIPPTGSFLPNETHLLKKDFPQGLVLKQSHMVTRKCLYLEGISCCVAQ